MLIREADWSVDPVACCDVAVLLGACHDCPCRAPTRKLPQPCTHLELKLSSSPSPSTVDQELARLNCGRWPDDVGLAVVPGGWQECEPHPNSIWLLHNNNK